MINKFVKVHDPSILKFMYPTFEEKTTIDFTDTNKDVLYTGRFSGYLREKLTRYTRSFICLTGTPDIDVSNLKDLVSFMYKSKGRNIPETVRSQLDNYSDEEILYLAKIYWVTGKWQGEDQDNPYTLYNLFLSTTGSLKDELAIYFSLLEYIPLPVIEASFFSFLRRVKNVTEQEVSPTYKRLLLSANSKFGNRISPAIRQYITSKSPKEIKFLNLLLSLR